MESNHTGLHPEIDVSATPICAYGRTAYSKKPCALGTPTELAMVMIYVELT